MYVVDSEIHYPSRLNQTNHSEGESRRGKSQEVCGSGRKESVSTKRLLAESFEQLILPLWRNNRLAKCFACCTVLLQVKRTYGRASSGTPDDESPPGKVKIDDRPGTGKSDVFVVEIGNDRGQRARWLVKVFHTECVECVDSYRV